MSRSRRFSRSVVLLIHCFASPCDYTQSPAKLFHSTTLIDAFDAQEPRRLRGIHSSNIKSAGNVVTFATTWRPISCKAAIVPSVLSLASSRWQPLHSPRLRWRLIHWLVAPLSSEYLRNIGVVQVTCLFITASVSSALLVLRLCLVRLPATPPHTLTVVMRWRYICR